MASSSVCLHTRPGYLSPQVGPPRRGGGGGGRKRGKGDLLIWGGVRGPLKPPCLSIFNIYMYTIKVIYVP